MMNYKIIIILYSLIFSLTAECKEYLYQWNYENQPYNVHINIQDSDVQDCIKKVDQWQKEAGTFSKGSRNYLRYLRYYPCGSYAAEIAEQLMLIGKENDFDRYQMGNFVTAFVNSFPYILDKDH
ncbi:MAG: hypothetical protein IT215_06930, partial [Chitinophagaceae bacterium]|nr:hypothetical protein [Chitinophagaceae bacterium]